jgi:general stress protein 26
MASKHEDATRKLWSMIKDIRFAMLISEDGDLLRSRPMAVSQRAFDGTLWFFTRADSHKVADMQHDDRVAVSYADPDSRTYVSLSGHARLVRDSDVIKEHWNEAARAWFSEGREDPDIALLRVNVEAAEYWDAPSSAMVQLYGYTKAALTGRPVERT